jgi:hypothetical protein
MEKSWRNDHDFIDFLLQEYGSVTGYESEKTQIIYRLYRAFLFGKSL